MFSGTVKENIDPDGQFQEDEIVRTLHFLKVFEALQFYTGYKGTKEMQLFFKEKEGLVELKEVDIDDFENLRTKGINEIHFMANQKNRVVKRFSRAIQRKRSSRMVPDFKETTAKNGYKISVFGNETKNYLEEDKKNLKKVNLDLKNSQNLDASIILEPTISNL